MRYLTLLAVAGLAVSSLLTAGPALAGAHATLPTPTKIVLFQGGGSTKEIGPAGQVAGQWTISTEPAKIVTTNDGTLEQSSDVPGGCDFSSGCGDWRYDPRPSAVQDLEFYWVEPGGQKVYANDLAALTGNNSQWHSLGKGVYTPLCMSWVVVSGNTSTLHYIELNLTTHKWTKVTPVLGSLC
jgi:hypothetical protein